MIDVAINLKAHAARPFSYGPKAMSSLSQPSSDPYDEQRFVRVNPTFDSSNT